MMGRRKKVIIGVLATLVLGAGFALVWAVYGPFTFASAAAKAKEEAALLNTRDPQRMIAVASRFYWGHNLPLADPLFQRAETLFLKAHDPRDALYAKIGLMRTQNKTSFPKMSAFIAAQLQTSMVQHDPFLRLWCLGIKGDADDETNVAAAAQDWHAVRKLAKKLGQKDWANRARGELGLVAFLRGNYKRAAAMIGKALTTAIFEGDDGTEERYLELVGNGLDGLDRPSSAMYFFDRAVRIAHHNGYVGTPFMAYEGRAEALEMMGHHAQAKALMKRTLAEARREKMVEHVGQDLLILGEFAMDADHPAKARTYLTQAAVSANRMGMCRVVAQSYFELAKLSEKAGSLKQAADETEKGAHYMALAGDTIYLPGSLDALAALKAKTGHLDQAQHLYRQAEDVINGMLLRVPGAYSESSLLSAMSSTYLSDFRLAANQDNPSMAFGIIEQARGRTVADMLRDHQADPPAKVDTALATKVSDVESELLETTNRQQHKILLYKLEEDEEELGYQDNLLNPTQRRLTEHPAVLAAVQKDLQPNEAVLEYVLADPRSFCLAFDQRTAMIVKLPAGKKQLRRVATNYLKRINAGEFARAGSQKLYSMLLAPVPRNLRPERLVIIPDGFLNDLPFEAFQNTAGHYVIESHVVSYAPSATVLDYLRRRKVAHHPEMAFLGIGDVPYGYEARSTTITGRLMHFVARGVNDLSGGHLYDLPQTRQELINADDELGHPHHSVLLMGTNATETKFESEPLSDFKVIHFAVHGYSNPDFPDRSALILGREPHSKDDGLLEVQDIAHLSLNADLVTLSSCDTGTGKIEGEEGIMGMVPAFLFAGARSVVASLWPVDDSATAIEMKQFYKHLSQGDDIATALQQAKLDYMHMLGSRPPIYWAGFILVGDGSRRITP